LAGQVVYQGNGLTVQIDSGSVNLSGDWAFEYAFSNWRLTSFIMNCSDVGFCANLKLSIKADQAVTLLSRDTVLARAAKYNIFFVGDLPIVLYTEVELRDTFAASIAANYQQIVNAELSTTGSMAVVYSSGQWTSNFSPSYNGSITGPTGSGTVTSTINLGLTPYISFRLYRVLGPYASLGLRELVKGTLASPSLDWDFYSGAWVQATGGVRATVLSKSFFDYSKTWSTDTLAYQTPFIVRKITGDNQTGYSNQYLQLPIIVQVLDNDNNPQSNVPVYFNITPGGGMVANNSVLTDQNGYAGTSWKLGTKLTIQTLQVTARTGQEKSILNAPLEFAATNNRPYLIGDTAFGGIIFYLDSTGVHGLVCAPQDQTSAAGVPWDPTPYAYNPNYPDNTPDSTYQPIVTGAIDPSIGAGAANTNLIVSKLGPGAYAASLCKNLVLNGYNDWYLPSWDELITMYANLLHTPYIEQISAPSYNFQVTSPTASNCWDSYWSSTEFYAPEGVDPQNLLVPPPDPDNGRYAWDRPFDPGNGPTGEGSPKFQHRLVRAIRAF
jgi:hypothetical protein